MLEVMRDILQSRYLRSNVAQKQLARTSLSIELYGNLAPTLIQDFYLCDLTVIFGPFNPQTTSSFITS